MKRAEANKIVRDHVLWSMGAGLVPFPMFDIAAVTAVQVDMLQNLAAVYEIDLADINLTAFISALTGSTFARIGASFIKAIPGIGTIIGGVSMSIMSGASTYAVGEVAISHLEAGGLMNNIDMERAKNLYNEAFEKGKAFAADLKVQGEASVAEAAADIADVADAVAGDASDGVEAADVTPEMEAPTTTETDEDVLTTLEKLADLRERGVLTEEEFTTQKQRLLARL